MRLPKPPARSLSTADGGEHVTSANDSASIMLHRDLGSVDGSSDPIAIDVKDDSMGSSSVDVDINEPWSRNSTSTSHSTEGAGLTGSSTSHQGSGNSDATDTTQGSSKSMPISVVAVGVLVLVGLMVALWICVRRKKLSKPSGNPVQIYESANTPNPVRPLDEQEQQLPVSDGQIHELPLIAAPSPASGLWDDPAIIVFRIPHEKVLKGTLVAQGGYGEVYQGTYKGEQVAIKLLQPALRNDLKQINAFLAEAKIMASIEHERVVPFIGVAWDSLRDLCVVTKFMDGGDLRSLLKQFAEQTNRPQGLDADKIRIAMHVAHALAYLHSLKPVVIHRDLKSRNILLDAEWNASLTDFGISREATDQTMTAGVGTMLWMAPEVMMGERYDEKADIFSFGLVLTEMDSHQIPYASAKSSNSGRTLQDTAILQMVAMGRLQAQFSQHVPQWLREVGTSCLSLDPTARPHIAGKDFIESFLISGPIRILEGLIGQHNCNIKFVVAVFLVIFPVSTATLTATKVYSPPGGPQVAWGNCN